MTDVEVEIDSVGVKSCAGFPREVGFSVTADNSVSKSSADGLSRVIKVFEDTTPVEDSKERIDSERGLVVD